MFISMAPAHGNTEGNEKDDKNAKGTSSNENLPINLKIC